MPALLSQILRDCDENTLLIADENTKPLLVPGFGFTGTLLSNRWDIVELARNCGIGAVFSDFDLAGIDTKYSRIVYPVSKEKAAVHHVINNAPQYLCEGGELVLLGSKTSGIKTYAQKAAQRFGTPKHLQKLGSEYQSCTLFSQGANIGPPLDDADYPHLRKLDELDGLYSKPGLFGWNKVDVGSALLASHFENHLPNGNIQAVDLGCGYGYLSAKLAAAINNTISLNIIATDNNAAAIAACEKNFLELGVSGEVIPADAGSAIPPYSANLVICNPPFHQGFQVEGDLTDRFLTQAERILRPQSTALFVVNEFIPLGRKAQNLFKSVELLGKEKGFCVYRLRKA
ncbi:methyltransferase [Microbulbifer bruguierae]|uniref:Methyltransferase n=1 Tax=Microbulbifer bruguierae TaxID=3029061 RepID=A0ABY8NEF5_9GAMM|nr:methyltransferase [Microbulbifer bruguierae]WGL17309.1 methyltransferase [Microbulbifer bruguierae]